jgi:hypothetical protein
MPPNDTWITWRMLSNPPWLGAGVSYPGAPFSGCPASVFRELVMEEGGKRWAEAGAMHCLCRWCVYVCVCGVSPQCRTSLESTVPGGRALSRPSQGCLPLINAGILLTGVCMRDPAALLPLNLPLALLHVPGMGRFGNQPFGRTRDMWALSAVPVPAGEPLACEGDAGRRGLPQSHDMAPAEWEEAMHCKHPGLT